MKIALHKCIVAIFVTIHVAFAQTGQCKDETQKAETLYEMCSNLKQSASYTDCIKIFVEQKTKSNEACQTNKAPPAPTPAPAVNPVVPSLEQKTPEPAPVAAPVAIPVAAPVAAYVPARSLASSALSSSCMNEFTGLASGDFDMLNFVKKLPTEVVKVKAQLKLPFGKPADSKKTDIGITVGCLKAFPESPQKIMPMLKDVSIEMAKSIVASKFGVAKSEMPNDIIQLRSLALQGGATSVVNALDFLGNSDTVTTAESNGDRSSGKDSEPKGEISDGIIITAISAACLLMVLVIAVL